jgi:hypothetical protein
MANGILKMDNKKPEELNTGRAWVMLILLIFWLAVGALFLI